jgi:hypothetical protein
LTGLTDAKGLLSLSVSSSAKLSLVNTKSKSTIWAPIFAKAAKGIKGTPSFCVQSNGSVSLTVAGTTLWHSESGLPMSLNMQAPFRLTISKAGEAAVLDDTCKSVLVLNVPKHIGSSLANRGACNGTQLPEWGQCGGTTCPGNLMLNPTAQGYCPDAPYDAYCCPAGWLCLRQHAG